jgi:hypothetical protein
MKIVGVVLEAEKYGANLNKSNEVVDISLARKNFKFAAEKLGALWTKAPLFGEDVFYSYIESDEGTYIITLTYSKC